MQVPCTTSLCTFLCGLWKRRYVLVLAPTLYSPSRLLLMPSVGLFLWHTPLHI